MNTYAQFKQQESSEKISLAIVEAAKRLVAFTHYADDVWTKSLDVQVISQIASNGISLSEVSSLDLVTAGKFYNDRENQLLYIKLADSSDPADSFITLVQKFYFSSAPCTLPHDLSSGFEVYWEPQIKSTSNFGVQIDTVNQQNEAIEGTGTLTLSNDQVFWPANFDKLFFENQRCMIYSWSRGLPASEAKLLFVGKVESKTYSSSQIQLKMKDLISSLKDTIQLQRISELGLRNPVNLDNAFQRMVFGRVFGHRPTNLDSLIDGSYPLTGTISVTQTSSTITGSGTLFLTQLSPDDNLEIAGVRYTVATVDSDTSATLSEVYAAVSASGLSVELKPSKTKRFINRVWNLAGHALRQPTPLIAAGSTTGRLFLTSTEDIFAGDELYVGTLGSGELVTVDEILNGTILTLATSLASNPTIGTVVTRPCIQDVRIDDTALVFYRDYTVDPDTATLILRDTAEIDAASTRESLVTATFTNGSRIVTGTGTFFKSTFEVGWMIRPKGTVPFFEILSIDSDTQMTLRSAPATTTVAIVQYKTLILNPEENVLTVEILGRTTDGTSTGTLLRKAPEIIETLLDDAGLSAEVNSASFVATQQLAPEDLAFVIPAKYDSSDAVIFRTVINEVNKSVFGILYQDSNFQFAYDVLRPAVTENTTRLRESDILDFTITSTNKNMIKKAIVKYAAREYDYNVAQENILTVDSSSDIANYILGTGKERTFTSLLVNQSDAQRLAGRWKFLLEFATNSITISTKLQTIDLEINDVLDIEHRKLFERFGGTSKRKIVAIEKITKSATGVQIDAVDLSNAFNRVALISDTLTDYDNTSEEYRIKSGFYTDSAGLIGTDENSFYSNLIW